MKFFFIQNAFHIKMICFFLVMGFSCLINTAKAQLGKGCYVEGVLYTSNTSNGNRYFYRSPGNISNPCGYVRTGNIGNCRLYNSGPLGNNSSYTLYTDAFSSDWAEVECPIDDYVWLLLVAIGGISILRFRPSFTTS